MSAELPWTIGYRAFESEVQSFADLCRELAHWGVELRGDGVLLRAGTEIGVWEPRAADDPLLVDAPCPLVGPRIGAIALDIHDWAADATDRHELFCGLMKEGRDVIAHRPTRRHWHAIHLEERSLGTVYEKYSLDDGAMLVTRESSTYARWMVDTLEATLRAAGYTAGGYWSSTHHNTLRLWSLTTPDGVVVRTEERGDCPAIDRLVAKFWLFDFAILEQIEQVFAG